MAFSIETEKYYTITCAHCGIEDTISSKEESQDAGRPGRYFHREGWREVEGQTLCPDCVREVRENG